MAGATSLRAFYMSGRARKGNAGGSPRLEPEWSDPSANPKAGKACARSGGAGAQRRRSSRVIADGPDEGGKWDTQRTHCCCAERRWARGKEGPRRRSVIGRDEPEE